MKTLLVSLALGFIVFGLIAALVLERRDRAIAGERQAVMQTELSVLRKELTVVQTVTLALFCGTYVGHEQCVALASLHPKK